MQCYIINLDRAPERMHRISELLQSYSANFVRHPATDGAHFTKDEIALYRSKRTQGKPLTTGEIACSESHLSIYRQIIASSDDYAVVMEDDLHLSKDAGDFINSTDWIPRGAEIIKLETVDEPTLISTRTITTKNNRELGQLYYKHWGSGAYVISKSAARKMLDQYIPGSTPIDDYLFDPSVAQFSLWQLQPAIAIQDVILTRFSTANAPYLTSEIEIERQKEPRSKRRKIGLRALAKRETIRLVRKSSNRLKFFWGIYISNKIIKKKISFRL